ncbi:MAG: Glutamyl-tRNA(Gln) amidotransferase subunit A [Candidatus Accumulibacter sp. SK-11]|nr:MAG: Glutamyl-tRNA(Gln) amidotransferase subunit A [Candidatus Accumulibacter sp. SK-11]
MIELSLADIGRALASREISSVELTGIYLDRIARLNPQLNAFITVDPERSLAQARAADDRLARGETRALTGIPIAHKDIFCARDWLTTCGSKMLRCRQSTRKGSSRWRTPRSWRNACVRTA